MCDQEWQNYLAATERVRQSTELVEKTPAPMAPLTTPGGEAADLPLPGSERQAALKVLQEALWDQIRAYDAYLSVGGSPDGEVEDR